MKEENINIENIEESSKTKKKSTQKAALGIRPSDYIEEQFKEMASTKGISQTKLFEQIFREYTHRASEEYRNENLDCSLELQNIKNSTTIFLKSIEEIVTKSQYKIKAKNREVKAINEATERKIELANIELSNRIAELEAENKALQTKIEDSNSIVTGFNTLKEDLESKNALLKESLDSKDDEIAELKKEIKERDKAIKSLEKDIENTAKTISNIEKEVALVKEEKNNIEAKLISTQATSQILQDTLNKFNDIKTAEIEAIKNNEATMSQLKISSLETIKDSEIERLQGTIDSLKESLELKIQENSSLAETYNNIVEAKEKELLASFNKEKAILEASVIEKDNIIKSLEAAKKEASKKKTKTSIANETNEAKETE